MNTKLRFMNIRTKLWHLITCEKHMWDAFDKVQQETPMEEWESMDDDTLFLNVMKASEGKCSPRRVMEVIQNGQ